MKLTEADKNAILIGDSVYINGKGASLYKEGTFKDSVEYYRLASAMGNDQATSNLGYCYLYGRDIEKNLDLAIQYFKIAASMKNIDANYKLGDIYESDKWGVKDIELSTYYYERAADLIIPRDYSRSYENVRFASKLDDYPSLSFALGRAYFYGVTYPKDLELSYLFLKHAKVGYEKCIRDDDTFFKESLDKVNELLALPVFNDLIDKYENDDDDDDYYDYDEES